MGIKQKLCHDIVFHQGGIMTLDEFHRILLCIVYGSGEVFNREFTVYNINCLNCPYKEICDKVVEIYFENKLRLFLPFTPEK